MKELTKEILQNSKWRVTPEQSKRLQEAAFELGFKWMDYEDKEVRHIDHPYLTFENNKLAFSHSDFGPNILRKFEDYFEEEIIGCGEKCNWGFSDQFICNESKLCYQCELKYKRKFAEKADRGVLLKQCKKNIGSFMWAVEQMKQGKKIKRKGWRFGSYKPYLHIENKSPGTSRGVEQIFQSAENSDHKMREDKTFFPGLLTYIEATDWEIYEEKKSLSDKSWSGVCFKEKDKEYYLEADIKEAIQKFRKETYLSNSTKKKLNEIFGEKLL